MPIGQHVILGFLFLFGAVIGSFLNVCIYRIPQKDAFWPSLKGLWHPPSTCPRCQTRISVIDNIPILGWCKLGGRCRTCRGRISVRYPLIEFGNGLLWVIVYLAHLPEMLASFQESGLAAGGYGPQPALAGWSPLAALHLRYLYHMVLVECLVVATFIDFDLRIIPDPVTLPPMAIGLLGGLTGTVFIVDVWFQDPLQVRTLLEAMPFSVSKDFVNVTIPAWIFAYPRLHGLAVSVVGLLVGGGLIWGVRIIGRWALGREAMGFGDVVLMATIGSFLGWQPTVIVFFLAPVCALVCVAFAFLVKREQEIPYGPYLSLATLIVIVGWPWIWPIARPIFELGPHFVCLLVIMGALLFPCLYVMQFAKAALGFQTGLAEPLGEWTSADQMAYFEGETVDHQQGLWRRNEWAGRSVGRGFHGEESWRRGSIGPGNHSWMRRPR